MDDRVHANEGGAHGGEVCDVCPHCLVRRRRPAVQRTDTVLVRERLGGQAAYEAACAGNQDKSFVVFSHGRWPTPDL